MNIVCDVGARTSVTFGKIQSLFVRKFRTEQPKFWMHVTKSIFQINRIFQFLFPVTTRTSTVVLVIIIKLVIYYV